MTTALGLATDYEWRREQALGRAHAEALRESASYEKRDLTYGQFSALGLVSPPTTSGVVVTQMTAFQVSAWWCGISTIAGDIGVLDFDLFKRVGQDDREKVTDHPVARILSQPNEYMVPKVFWETLMGHVLGWGNAYAEIERDRAGRPIALWPIMPNEIEPVVIGRRQANGTQATALAYRYRGQEPLLSPDDVLHIPGLGFDGIRGYSVVSLARESLGLAMAAQRFGGSFFGNGAWTGLVLEHPKQLSPAAVERLKASVEQMHRGSENAFKLLVAEEGMKVARPVTANPNEAQAVETREHQIGEVARWLKLPPTKLKEAMGARPGGNLESSEADYHVTTLLPWTTTIDQIVNRKLITEPQRGTYYVDHSFARRLQPTPIQRMVIQSGYQKMGVLDAEQIARQENLPKPKPAAVPPAADPETPNPSAVDPGALRRDERITRAALDVAREAMKRYARREAEAIKRHAKKGAVEFQRWADDFYRDEVPLLRGMLVTAVRLSLACRGLDGDAQAIAASLATAYLSGSKEELLGLSTKDLAAGAEALIGEWEEGRSRELADSLLTIEPGEARAAAALPTIHLTVNVPEQPPATVRVENTVPTPSVTVENNVPVPSVHVTSPAVSVAAPTVNVQAGDVHLPPSPAPVIENHNHIPAAAPTPVHVDVNVPPAVGMTIVHDRDGVPTAIRPVKG